MKRHLNVRHKYGHWLPRLLRVGAITLYPWVLYSESSPSPTILRHEWIHVEQVRRLGWLRFYIQYLLEYAWNLVRYRSHYRAYRMISFEAEAYRREIESHPVS